MATKSEEIPLRERILDATEIVLRRHGAEKTNVIDVARVLGMSHGNIYRHFENKKSLLDAVAVRWLARVTAPLAIIAEDRTIPAEKRLADWFKKLRTLKRRKVLDDPELFRAYHNHVMSMRDVVDEHVTTLLLQLQRIIADGVAAGDFSTAIIPRDAAAAFLNATSRFHHPSMIVLDPPPTDAEAKTVLALLLAGLRHGIDAR